MSRLIGNSETLKLRPKSSSESIWIMARNRTVDPQPSQVCVSRPSAAIRVKPGRSQILHRNDNSPGSKESCDVEGGKAGVASDLLISSETNVNSYRGNQSLLDLCDRTTSQRTASDRSANSTGPIRLRVKICIRFRQTKHHQTRRSWDRVGSRKLTRLQRFQEIEG